MTIYSWGEQSPIEKVETRSGKANDAIIFAAEGSQQGDLAKLPDMLRSLGMTVIPDVVDNKHVLRVSHFESEKQLTAALEQNSFVSADKRTEQESPKPEKVKRKPMDLVRDKSLLASGYAYFLGDALLAGAGIVRKEYNEVAQAGAMALSDLLLVKYGEQKGGKAVDRLYNKMLVEFAREGVEVPDLDHASYKDLSKTGGVLHKVDQFLARNPTETFTAINAVAGMFGIRAGLAQKNPVKTLGSSLLTAGMGVSLLVEEKGKKDKNAPQASLVDQLGDVASAKDIWKKPEYTQDKSLVENLLAPAKHIGEWVQEKPLRFGGQMALINNVFSVKAAINDRTANPALKSYLDEIEPHLKAGKTFDTSKGAGAPAFLSDEGKGHFALLQKRMTKNDFNELHNLNLGDPAKAASFEADSAKFSKMKTQMENAAKLGGAWKLNLGYALTCMVANGLLAISSKGANNGGGHGGGDKNARDPLGELVAASAAILAQQPEEEREKLINKTSAFLSEQRGIPMEPKEIAAKIREKIEQAKDSPWVEKVGKEASAPSRAQAVLQQRASGNQSEYALGA